MPDPTVTEDPPFPETCARCQTSRPQPLRLIGSTAVCEICLPTLLHCQYCHGRGVEFTATAGLARLCPDCVARVRPCESCRAPTLYDSRSTVTGGVVCPVCLDTYDTCVECQRATADSRYVAEGYRVCPDCVGSMRACRQCARPLISDGECDRCGQKPKIWPYSYRPDPILHGDPGERLHLGVELEVIVPYTDRRRAITRACQGLDGLGYLKQDSSIRPFGFEIVTHPMTYQYALQRFPWGLLDQLAELGCGTDASVGLHVHASRAGFGGPAHVFRWMKFLYRNQSDLTLLSRRTSRYAVFDARTRSQAKDLAKGPRHASGVDRRQAVNTKPRHTLELRTFAASLDTQSVQAALGFVDASIRYTAALTVPDIHAGGWDWHQFTAWAGRRLEYAPLTRELVALADGEGALVCAC
ncbi:hypothetical protein ACWEVD_00375 [Nocardia thailandica]